MKIDTMKVDSYESFISTNPKASIFSLNDQEIEDNLVSALYIK